jgi:hypothetical protein
MAFIKLQFKPGLNRDQSNYSGEGGWWACDKIRFRSGYPEKIGGWVKSTPNTMDGVCRQMNNWITTYSDNFLSAGTNEQVYIEAGGYFYNITPLRDTNPSDGTPDTDNCVYTTNGSTTVTITIATPHGMTTGDFVTISGVTGTGSAIAGIPVSQINGTHKVVVTTSTSFTFTVTTAATSTVSGQGGTAITLEYSLASGYPIVTAGYGWGVGTWGRDAWGLGAATPIYFAQRDWWFDNFDNDLVMNYRDGQMYWWARGTNVDPANALATRAVRMKDYAIAEGFDGNAVPIKVMQVLVSQQDKHLLAFGAVPFGSTNPDDFDPLLIRWADQDTPGEWTPKVTNSAGFIRVSRGSRIVRALPTRQEILVFTDTHLYTLQFLGTTDVFGLQEYADNISIASPRAVATAANITYWMGRDKFYAYTGRVETLPCSLRNHVFQNINMAQYDQIICGTNEEWNEVWWFYPTADSEYNNAYVIYNHLEKLWYYGTIDRTAWLDTPLRDYPLAANSPQGYTESFLYNHEDGIDDDDGPMVAYIQSNDFDLDDGEQFLLSRRMIPDISFNGSTAAAPEVALQIRPRNFPGTSYQDDPADEQRVIETSVDQYTAQVFIRARARQMALKVISEDMGVQWQLGAPRLDARADGKR